MTANEKTSVARLLDLASAVASGGYMEAPAEYAFADDAETDSFHAGAVDNGIVDSLDQIAADARACAACRLAQGRKNAVPGEGPDRPFVMVIGEGPGADEDASGRPFVGKAGQLLDKMLGAIGLSRQTNCYIANVVKCRPPENRNPQPDEIAACAPFLERQARLLRPAFILCAGKVAAGTLLRSQAGIGQLRGKITEIDLGGFTAPLLATYHPSALLRDENLKRPAWEDLKTLRSALERAGFFAEEN
ncbi:MAG: uracil-DNA glycosylase [Treponema sp.]|nr:uracil-DNA glycosylase [Treponema sp.]